MRYKYRIINIVHMKKILISALLLFYIIVANAQEQIGIVKAIGRPGQPGKPIENVMVRAQGSVNASLSDSSGYFSLALNHYELGQAYTLSRVSRMGYRLVDEDVIGRKYPYSDEVPLEISMVSNDVYNKTKSEIENKVRARIEEEYQRKYDELQQQLEARTISEEKHIKELCALNDYYDKSENLISKLADRYAKIDYDHLDSLDMLINSYIEQGELEEAEALIESKGTRRALEQLEKENLMLEQSLAEGKKAEAKMREDYAAELMTRYEIASLRFDNLAASAYLKERMELDTARVQWRMDYALFIEEYLGQYDEALAIFEDVLKTEGDLSVIDDVYGSIGNLYQRLGEYDRALDAYRTSMQIRTNNDLPRKEIAKSCYNIAGIHLLKDEYDSALEYLEKSRIIYDELADSLGMSGVYVSMADNEVSKGNLKQAVNYLKKALEIRTGEYGQTNQKVALVYRSLSEVSRAGGNYEEAAEYIDKAFEIFVKIFGDRHPNVASAYLTKGALAMETDEFDKALMYYQNAVSIFEEFYKGVHPDIAASYNKLANYYAEAESDFEKAVFYCQKSKELGEKIYGINHSYVAVALNNLAVYYSTLNKYEDALTCYEQAMNIRMQLFGETHYSIGEIYHNMATISYKLDRYDEAIELQENALRLFISNYGETHPKVGRAYNNLGQMHSVSSNYSQALDCFDKAKFIYKESYGGDNVHIATVCNNMASIYAKLKQYEKAEELSFEALEIRLRKFGENHLETGLSYNNIGSLYQNMGNWGKAEEYMKLSLSVMQRIFANGSLDVVVAYSNLSTLYRDTQQYELALEYALKAMNMSEDLFGWNHMNTIVYRFGVSECLSKLQQYDEAISYLSSLFDYTLAEKGPTHNYTKRFFTELHKSYNAVMSMEDYDGSHNKTYAELVRNSIVIAQVEDNSLASNMGLNGEYYVMEFEEWSLEQGETNFFVFNATAQSRKQKTYVLYRDGEFVIVPYEGVLGVRVGCRWIPAEEKRELIKKYHKWNRRR